VIKTVIGIYARNFQITPGRNMSGRNATNVVAVQLISGDFKSTTARRTAFLRLNQSFCLSDAHSIITIIVSIAIQRVKTREKFVKKLSEYQRVLRTVNVIKNESGKRILAIRDSLNHTNKSITRNTRMKVCIAVVQRFL
jgi:hypothetical protein